jgi:tagatose-1,6-bisphosphate aldolase non-catalytic subunit AgaZ/GatZ
MGMSKFDKIYEGIEEGKTLFGVGPMSWNCIDAAIEVANEKKVPIVLIASRRQVETEKLGGGYVTTTEKLGKYVREKDAGNWVFLARDHGGPWQGNNEGDLDYLTAMKNARESYEADIVNDFDIIHLDPSLKSRPLNTIIEDIEDLYVHCRVVALRAGKDIIFEVGTEEHGGHITEPKNFSDFIYRIKKLELVKFVVGNTGLYVKETANMGFFNRKNTKEIIKTCNKNKLYFKAHNTDYVSSDTFQLMNEIGVHSLNIAPEYGVEETKIILKGLNDEMREHFINMAVKSEKWKKWLVSDPNQYNDLEKAIICGHYVFNDFFNPLPQTPRVAGMLESFNSGIKSQLKDKIKRHLRLLGWEENLNVGEDEQKRW